MNCEIRAAVVPACMGLISATISAQTSSLLYNGIQIGDSLSLPATAPDFRMQLSNPDATSCSAGCVYRTHGLASAQ